MILSNVAILEAIENGDLLIEGLDGMVPTEKPFNTTAVDLRLGTELSVPKATPTVFDLRRPGISRYLQDNSDHHSLTDDRPFARQSNCEENDCRNAAVLVLNAPCAGFFSSVH
jgi:dCTP deaminase